jgi:hypothetical protein
VQLSADADRRARRQSVPVTLNTEGTEMTPETLTSVRELDSRVSDGIQVKLLWCECDGRLWVTVVDEKSRDAFCVEVREHDRPLEVFHHPFAHAGYRGIMTTPPSAFGEADAAMAA